MREKLAQGHKPHKLGKKCLAGKHWNSPKVVNLCKLPKNMLSVFNSAPRKTFRKAAAVLNFLRFVLTVTGRQRQVILKEIQKLFYKCARLKNILLPLAVAGRLMVEGKHLRANCCRKLHEW